jgi:hypothetical protein
MKQENEIVEVFYGTMWKASLLKSILEDNGIIAIENNTINSHSTYLPNGQMSVLVPNNQADKAKAIVKQFKQNNSEDIDQKD